eukprot:gb/GECH01010806.1/.p1 GENE.gb/GECH01010806.1/~~gb/GECH01010806.1/.p1  ORF type:complete len:1156 (+),score=296.64 gb/GECH01010806.1/:1-3468(+)
MDKKLLQTFNKDDKYKGDLDTKKVKFIQDQNKEYKREKEFKKDSSLSSFKINENKQSTQETKNTSKENLSRNNFNEELMIAIEEQNLNSFEKIVSNQYFRIDDKIIEEINERTESKPNREKYIDILSSRIINHRLYPDGYTCLLLAEHVYNQLKEGETFKPENNTLTGGEWKVHAIFQARNFNAGYYAVLFVNETMKQLVLAHRGISASIKDAAVRGGGVAAILDSTLRQNIGSKLHSQQLLGAQSTAAVVQLIKEGGLFSGYSLTSTGHSLGGWLAQLSAFYSQSSFLGQENVPIRAISFDSPGAKDMMKKMQERYNLIDLSSLDIINYISSPNPINCINEHAVKPYKVEGVIEFNSKLLMKNKQRMFYSIMSHSLESLKQAFDPSTGKPKQYSIVHNWPVIKYNMKSGYSTVVNHLPDLPLLEILCPGSSIVKGLAQKCIKKGFGFASKKIGSFAPLSIANTMSELFSGQIDMKEFTTALRKLGSDYREKGDHIFSGFKLNFVGKYKVFNSDNYKFTLSDHKHDVLVSKVLSANKSLEKENPIIRETIRKFQEQFKEDVGNGFILKSENIYEIREQAEFIISIAPEILKNTQVTTYGQVEIMIENAIENISSKTSLTSYIENGVTDQFISRSNEMNQLKTMLLSEKQRKGLAVIYGFPGTGKSTLAVKFGQDHFDIVRQFTQIKSKQDFLTKYFNLSQILNINHDTLPSDDEEWGILVDNVHSRIQEAMNTDDQKILFILDNISSNEVYEEIKHYLNNLRQIGVSVIIITQISNIGISSQQILLQPFTDQESKQYLTNLIRGINKNNVDDLFETVRDQTHGLPNALSAVVSFFNNKQGMTVSEYKELFDEISHDQGYRELGLEPPLSVLLKNIVEHHPLVWEMLQYLSYLAPETIPKEIFKEIFGLKQLLDIQHVLFSRSLLTTGDEGLLSTHQILQHNVKQMIRYLVQKNERETIIDPRPKLLSIFNKKLEFLDGDIYRRDNWKQKINEISIYIPHAVELTKETYPSQECAKLLNFIGKYCSKILSDFNQSIQFLIQGLKIREEILESNHPDTANSYNNVGRVYYKQEEYDKSLEYLKKGLKIRKKMFGLKHPETAESYDNIGRVYFRQKKYDEALEYYETCLKIREALFRSDHYSVKQIAGRVTKIRKLKS